MAYTKVVKMSESVNEELKKAKSITSKGKYLCAIMAKENKCWEYNEIGNSIQNPTTLPDELKSAKQLESNDKFITGITTDGDLFTYIPEKSISKNLGQVIKFRSRSSGICAITASKQITCWDPYFKTKNIPEEFTFKATDMSMSNKAVCASSEKVVKCWDFWYTVTEFTQVHSSKSIKYLSNSDDLVCTLNKQGKILCEKSTVGSLQVVIPKGFETKVKKVVAGVSSTAIIDDNGDLKFWFNGPMFNEDTASVFKGYKNGKMSLSKSFLCAINSDKQLAC